jgi:hypothetical protein
VALSKYKDPKIVSTFHEAADKLITEDIIPNNKGVEGLNFRE